MPSPALNMVLQQLDNAARQANRPSARLLAVSKRQSATAVAELTAAWVEQPGNTTPAFGENYVQEALAKQAALARHERHSSVEWHLIGHLQSNKAGEAATAFDWVQTVDRVKLVALLATHRPAQRGRLNVLVQVNVDDESSKHGCHPDEIATLAAAIVRQPQLALRGLMSIPAPYPEMTRRREAFGQMKLLFDKLHVQYPQVDTLSMGMSEDFTIAVAEGATMVRVGTALFGAREMQHGTRTHVVIAP